MSTEHKLPAPGTYSVRPHTWRFQKSQKGNIYLAFDVKIVNGPHEGTKARANLALNSDDNVRRTVGELRKVGWTGTDLNTLHNSAGGLEKAIVNALIDKEEYEGRTFIRVVRFLEPGEVADVSGVDRDELRDYLGKLDVAPAEAPPARKGSNNM